MVVYISSVSRDTSEPSSPTHTRMETEIELKIWFLCSTSLLNICHFMVTISYGRSLPPVGNVASRMKSSNTETIKAWTMINATPLQSKIVLSNSFMWGNMTENIGGGGFSLISLLIFKIKPCKSYGNHCPTIKIKTHQISNIQT